GLRRATRAARRDRPRSARGRGRARQTARALDAHGGATLPARDGHHARRAATDRACSPRDGPADARRRDPGRGGGGGLLRSGAPDALGQAPDRPDPRSDPAWRAAAVVPVQDGSFLRREAGGRPIGDAFELELTSARLHWRNPLMNANRLRLVAYWVTTVLGPA